MVNEVLLETLREIVGEQAVRRDVPMSGLTTFQIGGPAAVVVEPASVREAADVLAACHGAGQPVRLLGLGSDLLVADSGLPEVVVRFAERFSGIVVEGSRVTVQAGASNAQVAEAACAAGLAGYEFASGIPGTIGGAAIMNAGAYVTGEQLKRGVPRRVLLARVRHAAGAYREPSCLAGMLGISSLHDGRCRVGRALGHLAAAPRFACRYPRTHGRSGPAPRR